jgi:hypothetical protein
MWHFDDYREFIGDHWHAGGNKITDICDTNNDLPQITAQNQNE